LLRETPVMDSPPKLERSALTMPAEVFRTRVLFDTEAVEMGAGSVMVEVAALDFVSVKVEPLKAASVRAMGKAGLRSTVLAAPVFIFSLNVEPLRLRESGVRGLKSTANGSPTCWLKLRRLLERLTSLNHCVFVNACATAEVTSTETTEASDKVACRLLPDVVRVERRGISDNAALTKAARSAVTSLLSVNVSLSVPTSSTAAEVTEVPPG
jgi:hypothetical protein